MPQFADIRAVTFDCFGTLIDWNQGIGEYLAAWASQNGLTEDTDRLVRELGAAQRHHQVIRPFKPYRIVLRDAFLDVARAHRIDHAEPPADGFSASVADWPAFPDTLEGLRRLKDSAMIGVLSNVDGRSFARVHAERLGSLIDEIVTADDVEAYKPDHAHFVAMGERLARRNIGREAWLHVAQSKFHDIAPCRELGIACIWLDRVGARPDRGMTVLGSDAEPDLTAYGMSEVIAAIEHLGA